MVPGRTDPFARATGRAAWVTTLLLAAILLASCARAGEQQAGAPVATATLALAATPTWTAASPIAPAETGSSTPVPVATSRGPNLEATDPASVRLDSGGLQLVEFFRFTWATCRAMAPMVHGLEAKYSGRIKFSYLDADDPNTAEFQRRLGFRYQPELYLLDAQGNVLKKFVGYQTQVGLEGVFAEFLQ